MLGWFGLYRFSKWVVDNEHDYTLRDLIAVALALGMLGLFVDSALMLRTDLDEQLFLLGCFGVFAIPGFVVLGWRLFRPFRGRAAIPTGRCTFCKREAETTAVRFLSATGALIVCFLRERAGFACRRCMWRQFAVMTGKSILFGWASIFSLFVFQGYVIHNVLLLARALLVKGPSAYARRQAFRILDERRDYARALAATKPSEVAVDVLEQVSDVPRPFVAAYVATLHSGDSAASPLVEIGLPKASVRRASPSRRK